MQISRCEEGEKIERIVEEKLFERTRAEDEIGDQSVAFAQRKKRFNEAKRDWMQALNMRRLHQISCEQCKEYADSRPSG